MQAAGRADDDEATARPAGEPQRAARFGSRPIPAQAGADVRWPHWVLQAPVRIFVLVRRGITQHRIGTRAAALAFTTLFSLVPTLAVAFAMFKAFGGLQQASERLLPKLLDFLAVGVREQAATSIRAFLENVHTGAIGAVGFLFMVVSVVSLIGGMEDAFDAIWGVRRARGYFERLSRYWTIVTIAPTLLVLAVSLPKLVLAVAPLRWLLVATGTADAIFGTVLPLLLICAAFALTYAFVTNARVPAAAAVAGGVAGGASWYAAAHGYAWYAGATTYYSTLYGSLAALPIFLLWMYVSWIILLLGAEVAFAVRALSRAPGAELDPDLAPAAREVVALRLVEEVCARFLAGREPADAATLARTIGVSPRLANELLPELVDVQALAVGGKGGDGVVVPAAAPERLHPGVVLRRLRERGVEPPRQVIRGALAESYLAAADAACDAWNGTSFATLAERRGDGRDDGKEA